MSQITAHPNRRWWALGVLALTQLVVVLDTTIVTVALPQAQAELGLTDGQRGWIVTAYALAFGALLLLGGRVADYWGRKRTFMAGMIGFGLASAWAGLSQSGGEIIAARAVQGAFAALLAPAALAMLTVIFTTGKDRNVAFAVFGAVGGAGAAIGLLLGGTLTEFVDWRWCLLVNVIFVIIAMIGGALLLTESRAEQTGRFDTWGAITVVLGLGALVYGFTLAEHGWAEANTITLLAAGVALLVIFILIEVRVANPLLPMRVLLDRTRGAAFLVQLIVGAVMIGAMLYFTFHFQVVMGMSPFIAGLANVAVTVASMLCTPLATTLLGKFGPRPIMTVGPLLAAAGLFWLTFVTPDGSYWTQVLPGLLVMGVGLSGLFVPIQNLALSGVRPQDSGVASATVNSAFHIGGSIGLAIFTVFYGNALATSLENGVDQLSALTDGYSAAFLAAAVAMVIAAIIAFVMLRGSSAAEVDPEDAAIAAEIAAPEFTNTNTDSISTH